MKKFYGMLMALSACLSLNVAMASAAQQCPFTAAQLAKPIYDVHFYLVYHTHYIRQPGKKYRRGLALMPDQNGNQMLIWQKPLFYNHPIRSVQVTQNAQTGSDAVRVELMPEDASELGWISQRFKGKGIAMLFSETHFVCGDGHSGMPAVTAYTAAHVINVATIMSPLSGSLMIEGLTHAEAEHLAHELGAGIYGYHGAQAR